MSMYIVWPSVLSVINLKIHKTKAVKNVFVQEKIILRLSFNPGLVLPAFEQPGPGARFSKPRKLFGPVKPFLVHLHLKTEKCIRLKLLA